MPYFARRPSPLLVLTGSAVAALTVISLGLALVDKLPPPRAHATLQAVQAKKANTPATQARVQQLASARGGR